MRDSKNRSAGIRSDSGGVGLVRHFPISDLSTLVLRSVIHRFHVSVSLSIRTHREGRHRISSVYVVRDARLPCSRFLSDREEVESLSTTTANRPIKATDCSSLLDCSELHASARLCKMHTRGRTAAWSHGRGTQPALQGCTCKRESRYFGVTMSRSRRWRAALLPPDPWPTGSTRSHIGE
jgi:hypothetical protein